MPPIVEPASRRLSASDVPAASALRPGSASAYVTGAGTVSVPVPALIEGHSYGWYVRSSDGTTTTATAPVCHFVASAS